MPERALHARFAADRISGEWFRKSPALLALIDEIKAEALAPAKPAAVPAAVPPVTPDNEADKDFTTFAFGLIAAFVFPIAMACILVTWPATQKTDAHTDVHTEARVVSNPDKPVLRSVSAAEVNKMSAGDFQDWASGVRKRLHDEAKQKYWHNGHPTSKTWLGMQN